MTATPRTAPEGPAAMTDELARRSRLDPLHERLASRLREEIIKGWRPPGTALGEVEVAAEFGVSRNPVREAVRVLEAEGFLVSRPGRGVIVARIDEDEARGILEVRANLETLIARSAAERRTEDQLAQLHRVMAAAEDAMTQGRLDELPALNSEFHDLLAQASGNQVARRIIAGLMMKVAWMYSIDVGNRAPASWCEHGDLLKAIEAGDVEGADQLMCVHIANATADFSLKYRRDPIEGLR
ncbi:GntR family transcriptional regulator [Mycolicibacterium vanbaalenii]|nr:GntR family transcriptional regulator [Mycolicibacterium vanbaalenii]